MRAGKSRNRNESLVGRCEAYRDKIGNMQGRQIGTQKVSAGSENTDLEDRAVMKAVRAIAERGGDAEIRQRLDGSFSVYEVYKSKVGDTGDRDIRSPEYPSGA